MLHPKEEAEILLTKARDAAAAGKRNDLEQALDHIELFLAPFLASTEEGKWDAYRFTRREQRVVDCLFRRLGKVTHKEILMSATYFDQVNDWPQDKIMDIFMCRIREKLARENTFHVETAFGCRGWAMKEGPAPDGKIASGYRTGRTRTLTEAGELKRVA